jgi:cytochrome b559 alpha subunit
MYISSLIDMLGFCSGDPDLFVSTGLAYDVFGSPWPNKYFTESRITRTKTLFTLCYTT